MNSADDRVVVSDTSCFIALSRLNEFETLRRVFATVITTEEVAAEFREPLPEWIRVQPVRNRDVIIDLRRQIDLGEASAVALALERVTAFCCWTITAAGL